MGPQLDFLFRPIGLISCIGLICLSYSSFRLLYTSTLFLDPLTLRLFNLSNWFNCLHWFDSFIWSRYALCVTCPGPVEWIRFIIRLIGLICLIGYIGLIHLNQFN